MKKDRNIEQSHDSYKERSRQKIEKQLDWIEAIIKELMDGVDVRRLPLRERLMLTTRFVALYQHGISVNDSLGMNQKENRQNLAFSTIIRNLTADKDNDKEREDFRFIEAEITSYSEIEDDLDGYGKGMYR